MKVSVVITTYNHERYVRQAVESALGQQTDFDFEVIVSDDASGDGTRRILEDLAAGERRMRLLTTDTNRGAVANLEHAWSFATGDYVALLDGDDYWTSALRLQRMADVLDADAGCAMCFHDMTLVFEDRDSGAHPTTFCPPGLPTRQTAADLVVESFAVTSSAMVRRGIADRLPPEFNGLMIDDWPRFVLAASRGHVAFVPDALGVYRIHNGGFWSRGGAWLDSIDETIRMQRGTMDCYEAFWDYFPEHRCRLRAPVAKLHLAMATSYSVREAWPLVRAHVVESARLAAPAPWAVPWWRLAKLAAVSSAPVLRALKRRWTGAAASMVMTAVGAV